MRHQRERGSRRQPTPQPSPAANERAPLPTSLDQAPTARFTAPAAPSRGAHDEALPPLDLDNPSHLDEQPPRQPTRTLASATGHPTRVVATQPTQPTQPTQTLTPLKT